MANVIKYSTTNVPNTIKKGNFYLGVNNVGYGPTEVTGFWNGIQPPLSGYTLYENKATQGPSIRVFNTDAELISFVNQIGGNVSTIYEAINYFSSNNDFILTNKDYENVVTDGLILNLDAGFSASYPKGGTTWYDLSLSDNNLSIINGATYSNDLGGSVEFDGINNFVTSNSRMVLFEQMTWDVWFKRLSDLNIFNMVFSNTLPYLSFRGAGSGGSTNKFLFSWYDVVSGVNTQRTLNSNNTYSNDVWYNVTCTQQYDIPNNKVETKMYINGIFDVSASTTTESVYQTSTSNRLLLGRYPSIQYPFGGSISTLRVYNRVLTEEEILQNYNAMFYQWTNTLQNRVKSDGGFYEDTTNYTTEIIKNI